MMLRYISNGQSYSEFEGSGHPPAGCHFISEQEFYAARQRDDQGYEQRRVDHVLVTNALRASARKKLTSGEPLTEEEANLIIG